MRQLMNDDKELIFVANKVVQSWRIQRTFMAERAMTKLSTGDMMAKTCV